MVGRPKKWLATRQAPGAAAPQMARPSPHLSPQRQAQPPLPSILHGGLAVWYFIPYSTPVTRKATTGVSSTSLTGDRSPTAAAAPPAPFVSTQRASRSGNGKRTAPARLSPQRECEKPHESWTTVSKERRVKSPCGGGCMTIAEPLTSWLLRGVWMIERTFYTMLS